MAELRGCSDRASPEPPDSSDGIVVIPTYNECTNLPPLVASIWEQLPGIHILVVDDNSPDGTGEVAESLSSRYEGRLFVLHRRKKEGLGRAYVAAFQQLLDRPYKYVIQMDADMSHRPQDLPAMLSRLAESDVVIGSRYLNGVRVINWDWKRLLLSKLANIYASRVTGLPFTDLTGGFKVWRKSLLETINFDHIFSLGYLFQVEMTYWAVYSGSRVAEEPITFHERKEGGSKMNLFIILEAILGILRLRIFHLCRLSTVPVIAQNTSVLSDGR